MTLIIKIVENFVLESCFYLRSTQPLQKQNESAEKTPSEKSAKKRGNIPSERFNQFSKFYHFLINNHRTMNFCCSLVILSHAMK